MQNPRYKVVKFGGTSVADIGLLRSAARIVLENLAGCDGIVVVVSAMGRQTDELLTLAHEASSRPPLRELDAVLSTGEQVSSALLATILQGECQESISLTGAQAGIRTDDSHSNALIESIDTGRLERLLAAGVVPVVAGFQGLNSKGDTATLGRGGSDTTAAALAAALGASECVIYTDVKGVYTADPRICPRACQLDTIHFEEILEMAALGAKVLHPRAVEYAGRNQLLMRVRSTFAPENPGTLIQFSQETDSTMEKPLITGVTYNLEEAKITIRGVPDQPGVAMKFFSALAEGAVNVDIIVQNIAANGHTDITFTVHRSQRAQALEIVKKIGDEVGCEKIECDSDVAKVSIVGVGMRAHAGVAAQMFASLAAAKVNILMISTSEIRVSVIIDEDLALDAVRQLHKDFGLEASDETADAAPAAASAD